MSDFDEEKKNEQARPDYYQPNQGGTYYNPAQNDNADNNSTYHYSYVNNNQQNSSNSGNYYQPPKSDNSNAQTEYNSEPSNNNNSPKPPKKGNAGKVVAIILVICAFVAVVGVVLGVTGVIDTNKNTSGSDSTTQSQSSNSDVKTKDSGAVETKDSSGNLTVAGVAQKVMDSCVGITVYSQQQDAYNYFYNYGNGNSGSSSSEPEESGEGSGVIMSESNGKTYILTCAHVISDGTKFTVTLNNKKEYDATMVAYDSQTDIGVLSINATGLQVAEFANSDKLAVGEQVIAIGCPGGLEFMNSLTSGYISALDRPISSNIGYDNKCIQVDAAINPGNSGGALFNMQGQVIGINSAKLASTEVEGMGYAIPVSTASPIFEDLMNRQTRTKVSSDQAAALGIKGQTVDSSIAEAYGIPQGVYVAEIEQGSAAEKAGITAGSVITKFDDTTIESMDDLKSCLEYYAAGETVDLVVKIADNGSYVEKTLTITLDKADTSTTTQDGQQGQTQPGEFGQDGNLQGSILK